MPSTPFDEVIERRGTDSFKWDYTKQMLGASDVIPLWVADMDFRAPQPVLDALHQRVEHGIFGYTGRGDSYHQAIQDWLQQRHGWPVEKDWIAHMPGVVASLRLAVDAFTEPDERVIVQPPVYYPFFRVVENSGRRIVENPLHYDGHRYVMDFTDLESKLQQGAAMLILCSPHNPVGRVWTRSELQQLSSLCSQYGTLLVSDEIWADLVLPGHTHHCVANLDQESAENTITCIAPSKTFNLAGLTTSCVIIPDPKKAEHFKKEASAQEYGLGNVLGMTAQEAAYRHGGPWLDQLIGYLAETKDWVKDYLTPLHPQLHWIEPEATYLLWLNLNYLQASTAEMRDAFYHQTRAGVHMGSKFGDQGSGFVRVNIAAPRQIIREGAGEIHKALTILENRLDDKQ